MALVREGDDIASLTLIGAKINEAYKAALEAASLLTEEELSEFESYLGGQETLMPMSDPTLYAFGGGADALTAAAERVRLLRSLLAASGLSQGE